MKLSKPIRRVQALGLSARRAAAIQESATITKTQWQLMRKKASAKVDVYEILRTLSDKKIPFVLTGAHALGAWTGQPRATKDVDVVVKSGRNHARAVKALHQLYPQLEVRSVPGVTAFFVPGERHAAIDVSYPHRPDIKETLASRIWIEDRGLRYRIPPLEAALANKYGAMLATNRDPAKRLQDAADFTNMVRYSAEPGSQPIDLKKLRRLGEKVWPGGGGAEILHLVDQVQRGAVLDLLALMKE
jgi:hypothetical protein